MATTAAAIRPKEFVFTWEGKDRAGKTLRGEIARAGPKRGAGHAATSGHPGPEDPQAARPRRRQGHGEGHHAVHAPAGDHDESGRAAAAVLRHRRQRRIQSRGRQAADGRQDRGRNRLDPGRRVPQVPAAFRRTVLQPGGGGRAGRYSGERCSTAWRPTRKRSSRSSPRSSPRCSIRYRSSSSRSSSPR